MAYCQNCGSELNQGADVCLSCGKSITPTTSYNATNTTSNSEANFGWGCLGFFIPLIGFILYLVWLSDPNKKEAGKAAGLGALISIGLVFLAALAG
jgi:uncharacterized membrane protein YvbJ